MTQGCSLCNPGTFQTGIGTGSKVDCVLCSAGTYQTGYGQSGCTSCGFGKYFSGIGGTSDLNCSGQSLLPPYLQQQVKATTVVVSTVVSMVVSVSAAAAMGASIGIFATSSSSGGASIFQLIHATQFMNIFGKLIDKRSTKAAGVRRYLPVSGGAANTSKDSSSNKGNEGNYASEFRSAATEYTIYMCRYFHVIYLSLTRFRPENIRVLNVCDFESCSIFFFVLPVISLRGPMDDLISYLLRRPTPVQLLFYVLFLELCVLLWQSLVQALSSEFL